MAKEIIQNTGTEEMKEAGAAKKKTGKIRKRRRPFLIFHILRSIVRTIFIFSLGVFVGTHRKMILRVFRKKQAPLASRSYTRICSRWKTFGRC